MQGADFHTRALEEFRPGLQYIKDLYTNVKQRQGERKKVLFSGTCVPITVYAGMPTSFVRGENLLAQRYEINAGFPMPKATVMGGVNINF